jgi:hypothetical protein
MLMMQPKGGAGEALPDTRRLPPGV